MLEKRHSSRKPAEYITDADFADDFALISNCMEQAQLLLSRLEMAAETIGLHANSKKTEYMLFNQVETSKNAEWWFIETGMISNILVHGLQIAKKTWKFKSGWHGRH